MLPKGPEAFAWQFPQSRENSLAAPFLSRTILSTLHKFWGGFQRLGGGGPPSWTGGGGYGPHLLGGGSGLTPGERPSFSSGALHYKFMALFDRFLPKGAQKWPFWPIWANIFWSPGLHRCFGPPLLDQREVSPSPRPNGGVPPTLC